MTEIIHAAYEGSGCVRIGDRFVDYRFKGKNPAKSKTDGYGGVMPKAARTLMREGIDPSTIVRVTRNGTKVFEDATIGAWGDIAIEENTDAMRSIRVVKHRVPSWQRASTHSGGWTP